MDSIGQTPLHYAARFGHSVVVDALLARDDVKAANNEEWTAALGGVAEATAMVEALLAKGADVASGRG